MKKILFVLFAVALVFGSVSAVSHADGFSGWVKVCKETHNFWGYFKNQGQCVSSLTSEFNNGNDGRVRYCRWFQDNWPDKFDRRYKNFGDCVERGEG